MEVNAIFVFFGSLRFIFNTTLICMQRYIALGVLWPSQIAGNVAIVIALVSQSDTVNKKLSKSLKRKVCS